MRLRQRHDRARLRVRNVRLYDRRRHWLFHQGRARSHRFAYLTPGGRYTSGGWDVGCMAHFNPSSERLHEIAEHGAVLMANAMPDDLKTFNEV
ncbi:hypothetical protein [Parahaliea mediterranea]|uniref:hypothetical protein n=1 Tax=Parahaliea mediterranea TaxID=651086 RepID=UPI001300AF60|nr:hypothetical protein [Parahaliea mediterranea]